MDSARPVPLKDLPVPKEYNPGARQYYEKYDSMCDWIVRCEDCKVLVTLDTIHDTGACHKCGSHKFREARTLGLWEWFQIKMGILKFDHADEFLASFSVRGAK